MLNPTPAQIEAHTREHDEAQALRTDVCTDCGKPVDQAEWTVATTSGYQLEIRKFERNSRRLGRYSLTPRRGSLPFASQVQFDGTHDLHACSAFPDAEPVRPTEPWVELSDVEVEDAQERRHWTNCPDLEALGFYR